MASLWARLMRALKGSLQTTARTAACRLAAIDMPTPVPHTSSACAISPFAMAPPIAWAKSG